MIHPPLLGVVNAASAVSARTLTCRAAAVPRSCSMLSVYIAVRVRPFPKLPPLEQSGCGPSTLYHRVQPRSTGGRQEELRHPVAAKPPRVALPFKASHHGDY